MGQGPTGYSVKEGNISSFSVPPSGKALLRIQLPEAEPSKKPLRVHETLGIAFSLKLTVTFSDQKGSVLRNRTNNTYLPITFSFFKILFTLLVLYPNFILLILCFKSYSHLTFLHFMCSSHLLPYQTMPLVYNSHTQQR